MELSGGQMWRNLITFAGPSYNRLHAIGCSIVRRFASEIPGVDHGLEFISA